MKKTLEREFDAFVNSAFIKRVDNTVLSFSRYLFTDRYTGQAYCTHCHKYSQRSGAGHNESDKCPHCKSDCYVKMTGFGRGKMFDEAYYVEYKKSRSVKGAVIAIGVIVSRDYTEDYMNVKTKVQIRAKYLFDIKDAHMWKFDWDTKAYNKTSSVYSLAVEPSILGGTHISYLYKYESKETYFKAVKGTRLEYSADLIKAYTESNESLITQIATYCKRPEVEYMNRAGFEVFVNAIFGHWRTYHAINWRTKTVHEMLKISKQELHELRSVSRKYFFDFEEVRIYQIVKQKYDYRFTFEELMLLCSQFREYHDLKERVLYVLSYMSVKKALNYVAKQQINGMTAVTIAWIDYLRDCEKLEYDMSDDSILRPADLRKAHDRTIELVKHKVDEQLRERMKKRYEELLKEYSFGSDEYSIIVPLSQEDIINEGKALHHCVGGYAARHAEGKTTILFVRDTSNLDRPFYTMEVRGEKLIQCRGYKPNHSNLSYKDSNNEQLINFINTFEQEKLRRKSA